MGILRTDTISGLEAPTPVTGSVLFDGTGDYLQTTTNVSDFQFGSGDFTIESWVYKSTNGSNNYDGLCAYGDSGTQGWFLEISDARGIVWWSGSGIILQYDIDVSKNTWHHISVTRSNGTNRLFLNGIIVAENTTAVSVPTTGTNFYVGYYSTSGNYYFNGYISNLRILKGTALYTSNFTPPTRELQPIGDTVLLCCNNPDSAGAEATGKTITVNGNAAASTFSPGLTRDFTYGTQFQGVAKFDTQGYFVPPSGTTEQRGGGRGVFAGGNSSNTISYVTIATTGNSSDFGDLLASRSGLRGGSSATRGLFTHSSISPYINTIEYVTIASTGNAIDFGDMLGTSSSGATGSNSTRSVFWEGTVPSTGVQICYVTTASLGNASEFGDMFIGVRHIDTMNSPTRCIVAGGYEISSNTNIIQYITFATTGDAVEFGDVVGTTNGIRGNASTSSSTRGVYGGGANSPGNSAVNPIEYLTMSSLGNTQDFGDLTQATNSTFGAASSSIRGLFAGGSNPSGVTNVISYVTIATLGNAQDFGDLTDARRGLAGVSNSSRASFGGGLNPSTDVNTIDFVTIASTGNAQDFGDLSIAKRTEGGGTSNGIRGIFAGGYTPAPANFNTIEYITIASTGDAMDFGDLSSQTKDVGACSNSHGGLS